MKPKEYTCLSDQRVYLDFDADNGVVNVIIFPKLSEIEINITLTPSEVSSRSITDF